MWVPWSGATRTVTSGRGLCAGRARSGRASGYPAAAMLPMPGTDSPKSGQQWRDPFDRDFARLGGGKSASGAFLARRLQVQAQLLRRCSGPPSANGSSGTLSARSGVCANGRCGKAGRPTGAWEQAQGFSCRGIGSAGRPFWQSDWQSDSCMSGSAAGVCIAIGRPGTCHVGNNSGAPLSVRRECLM
jgi:hypothetical protein